MDEPKIVVMYHNDMDGKGCANIVKYALSIRKKREEPISFIALDYPVTWTPDECLVKDSIVYLLDFSFDPGVMDMLNEKSKEFVWIDHHITAIEKNDKKYNGLRDVQKAACELTWDYFFNEKFSCPWSIRYIADRDIWTKKYEKSNHFHEYLTTIVETDPSIDKNFLESSILMKTQDFLTTALSIGKSLYKSKMQRVIDYSYKGNFFDYHESDFLIDKAEHKETRIFFVNVTETGIVSLLSDYMFQKGLCDVVIGWRVFRIPGMPKKEGRVFENEKKTEQSNRTVIEYNMRCRDGFTVARFAKKHKGGGHQKAAGFSRNFNNSLLFEEHKEQKGSNN